MLINSICKIKYSQTADITVDSFRGPCVHLPHLFKLFQVQIHQMQMGALRHTTGTNTKIRVPMK